MSTISDMYRQHRAAQSGSLIYRAQPAAPPAPSPYERTVYGGLADYQQPRQPVPADQRSEEARRRSDEVSAWGRAARQMAEDAVTEDAWAAHRAVQDASGVDRGVLGKDDRRAYQQHLAANHFGRVAAHGHLASEASPGQPGVPRVYTAEIQRAKQRTSVAALRSPGEGWR